MGYEQRFDWMKVGGTFLFHVGPVQRQASLDEVLGGKKDLTLGSLIPS